MESAFDPDATYVISDECPYLDLLVEGRYLVAANGASDSGKFDQVPSGAGTPFWQRWNLIEQLSRSRQMGRYELPLKVPNDVSLRCYVIPRRLLDVADFCAMVEAVQGEFGRQIAWLPHSDQRLRAWRRHRTAGVTLTKVLLESLREELAAAESLRRDPPTEPGRTGRSLEAVPETRLIAHWAVRRGQQLSLRENSLRADLQMLQLRIDEHMPRGREEPLQVRKREAEALLRQVQSTRSRVLHYINTEHLQMPPAFGPIAQRDYRFRQLLRASAPPISEVVSDVESSFSLYPPISMNRLFECWGAVWLVERLCELGFERLGEPRPLGVDIVDACEWRLRRGNVYVSIDYEAEPALLNLDGVSPPSEREVSALHWAAAAQHKTPDRCLFGSHTACSPDYILRMEGPCGRVLAVGDACLSDPEYHGTGKDKTEVVERYRRSIYWWTGTLQGCDPLGGFVLLPGPHDIWCDLERKASERDVWLICPRPRSENQTASGRITRFFRRLIAQVE